jgi:hypothetical protein
VDIHKEAIPVYGGKCLSRKAVHIWVEKFCEGHSKAADDARPGAEVAEITVRRLLCCGFGTTETRIALSLEEMLLDLPFCLQHTTGYCTRRRSH